MVCLVMLFHAMVVFNCVYDASMRYIDMEVLFNGV